MVADELEFTMHDGSVIVMDRDGQASRVYA
jgi:hypothetical protein